MVVQMEMVYQLIDLSVFVFAFVSITLIPVESVTPVTILVLM